MKVYLSGPMTGYPEFNYPAFNAMAALLRGRGHEVYSPAEYGAEQLSAGTFDIRKAFSEYCRYICEEAEAIYLLRGWEKSKGALAEYHLALNCDLTIFKQV